ncbi:MAG: amidohydrolase family protein [Opitutaceae bacterium]
MSALIRLDGWTWEDLTVKPAVALHIYWPSMAIDYNPRAKPAVEEQQKKIDERIELIEDAFLDARAYLRAKESGVGGHDADLRWEAMIPVLKRELPVCVHADDLVQINAALDWAKEAEVNMILVGGRDAWRVATRLAEADVPVIIGGTLGLPARRDAGYDAVYSNPAKLHAAGVRFCIAGSAQASFNGNDRNLPYEAGMAAAFGLPPEEALKAVTLYPAQILGAGAELGSIEAGKRATLIVTDGDPLEIATQVHMAWIDGARIDLRSRHTGLYEKYRQRPR